MKRGLGNGPSLVEAAASFFKETLQSRDDLIQEFGWNRAISFLMQSPILQAVGIRITLMVHPEAAHIPMFHGESHGRVVIWTSDPTEAARALIQAIGSQKTATLLWGQLRHPSRHRQMVSGLGDTQSAPLRIGDRVLIAFSNPALQTVLWRPARVTVVMRDGFDYTMETRSGWRPVTGFMKLKDEGRLWRARRFAVTSGI